MAFSLKTTGKKLLSTTDAALSTIEEVAKAAAVASESLTIVAESAVDEAKVLRTHSRAHLAKVQRVAEELESNQEILDLEILEALNDARENVGLPKLSCLPGSVPAPTDAEKLAAAHKLIAAQEPEVPAS